MALPNPLPKRQTGYRLPLGEWFNDIIDRLNGLINGTIQSVVNATNFTQNGTFTQIPQIAVAAGSNSQSGSTPITKSQVVVVTVSATTRAMRLPVAATGKRVQINNGATTAVKVYPATNNRIATAATNAVGVAIAGNKGNIYIAQDAFTWRVLTGA